MRAFVILPFVGSLSLAVAGSAGAQQRPASRQPLVASRPELLQQIGLLPLEALRVRPGHVAMSSARTSVTPAPNDARPPRVCPMPVARPDTTALERMPIARNDSTHAAPMPVVAGCENPLFR